ncbi:MAG: lipopolysaccharide biosynthesis protein, partial [Geminicoccales bacterium]
MKLSEGPHDPASTKIGKRTAMGPSRYDYFDDTYVSANMAGNIVRGSAFVFAASIAKFTISIGGTAVLARLLDPEAYGLLAMVFVFTSFLGLFQDMNLSLATVQKERITHAQVSTIYWINVAVSCAIALVLVCMSPLIAWLYGEPRLTGIALLLTLPIVIRGIGAQHQALLRRKMRFGTLTAIDVGAMATGYLTAVMLAWHGYGYWSLVWLHIANASAVVAMNWIGTGWRPGKPVRGSGVRAMVAFGTSLTGYSIVRFTARSMDNAVIGWYWGAAAVGLYSKSRDLLGPVTNYLTSPIGAVAMPSLSRLTKDVPKYRSTFRRLAEKIACVTLPVAALVACTSNEIVGIVLGPKWVGAAPILAVLAVLIFT